MKPFKRATHLAPPISVLPEPHRSEIVRRLGALPAEPTPDARGAILVWVAVFVLLWMAAGLVACFYLFREGPTP